MNINQIRGHFISNGVTSSYKNVSEWNDGYEYIDYTITINDLVFKFRSSIQHHRHFGNHDYVNYYINGNVVSLYEFRKLFNEYLKD